ncbi:hypothetical protein HNS03_14045, partial [Amorphus sp. 3PC139-8]
MGVYVPSYRRDDGCGAEVPSFQLGASMSFHSKTFLARQTNCSVLHEHLHGGGHACGCGGPAALAVSEKVTADFSRRALLVGAAAASVAPFLGLKAD